MSFRCAVRRSSLLLNESCDFRPSSQYILVRVTPRCFRLVKILCCQVNFLFRRSTRYLTWSSQGSCTLFIWTGGHVPLHVVVVTWTDLRVPHIKKPSVARQKKIWL
jgi:hypothetical protein